MSGTLFSLGQLAENVGVHQLQPGVERLGLELLLALILEHDEAAYQQCGVGQQPAEQAARIREV